MGFRVTAVYQDIIKEANSIVLFTRNGSHRLLEDFWRTGDSLRQAAVEISPKRCDEGSQLRRVIV